MLVVACDARARRPDAARDSTSAHHADTADVRSDVLDHAARYVVGFLRGDSTYDANRFADSVTLYVAPEGGGDTATFAREQLRDPSRWVVQSAPTHLRSAPPARYRFAPPRTATKLTTKVGMHLNCGPQPLASRFPELARLPHVGAMLAPETMSSCLQTWNVTFVFDTTSGRPKLVGAVYDQFEW